MEGDACERETEGGWKERSRAGSGGRIAKSKYSPEEGRFASSGSKGGALLNSGGGDRSEGRREQRLPKRRTYHRSPVGSLSGPGSDWPVESWT